MLKIVEAFTPINTFLIKLYDLQFDSHLDIFSKEQQIIFYKNILIICDNTTFSSPELFIKIFKNLSSKFNVQIIGESLGKDVIFERMKIEKNYIEIPKYKF